MAFLYRDLKADYDRLLGIVEQFVRDGVIDPLKDFVFGYNNQEAQ